jgi:hypothetical protein
MATGSIPNIGSRVSVQLFAGDMLAHAGLVSIERYADVGYLSALFSDGGGVKVALTGDRSSVRMVLSAALTQLGPDDPEPPAVEETPEAA